MQRTQRNGRFKCTHCTCWHELIGAHAPLSLLYQARACLHPSRHPQGRGNRTVRTGKCFWIGASTKCKEGVCDAACGPKEGRPCKLSWPAPKINSSRMKNASVNSCDVDESTPLTKKPSWHSTLRPVHRSRTCSSGSQHPTANIRRGRGRCTLGGWVLQRGRAITSFQGRDIAPPLFFYLIRGSAARKVLKCKRTEDRSNGYIDEVHASTTATGLLRIHLFAKKSSKHGCTAT